MLDELNKECLCKILYKRSFAYDVIFIKTSTINDNHELISGLLACKLVHLFSIGESHLLARATRIHFRLVAMEIPVE